MKFFKKNKNKNQPSQCVESNSVDEEKDSISVKVELLPHFVYCDKDDKIIDTIWLTEGQARKLNKLLCDTSTKDQSLVFLRR